MPLILLFVVVVIELVGAALKDAVIFEFVLLLPNLLIDAVVVDVDEVKPDVVALVVVLRLFNNIFVPADGIIPVGELLFEWSFLISSLPSTLILKFVFSGWCVVPTIEPDVLDAVVFDETIVAAFVGVNCDKFIFKLFIGVAPLVVALLWNLYGIFSLFTSFISRWFDVVVVSIWDFGFNLLESASFVVEVLLLIEFSVSVVSFCNLLVSNDVVTPFISWLVWFVILFICGACTFESFIVVAPFDEFCVVSLVKIVFWGVDDWCDVIFVAGN